MRPATPPNPETPEKPSQSSRYVTSIQTGGYINPTPADAEKEDPQAFRLYRLCPCENCNGTGKMAPGPLVNNRCPDCRGEGRTLELVATCGNPEAVGVALVTLAGEGEWDECPFGLMHRPEGQTGKWLLKPWGPSARNVSDAGRTLATARHRDIIGGK